MDTMSTETQNEDIGARKARHLEICVDRDRYEVEFGSAGFEHVRILHQSLPEISEQEIDTSVQFLGHRLKLPLFISSMTGGSAGAYELNKNLARAAQTAGVPVGMGSIRILFRNTDVLPHFQLKKLAPDVPVFANIGAAQVRDMDSSPIVEMVKRLEVQALAVHLNPGQELIQPEGDRDFRGILSAIARFCERSPVPVIVKETGFGIRPDEAKRLIDAGAAYVNIAGAGGTNWITVEAYRLDPALYEAAREFDNWGTPTAMGLAALNLRSAEAGAAVGRILASGGLRTGMDLVKALALGATMGGYALPFIRAVSENGVDGVMRLIERFERVLRTAMVLTGSRTPSALSTAPIVLDSGFRQDVESMRSTLGE